MHSWLIFVLLRCVVFADIKATTHADDILRNMWNYLSYRIEAWTVVLQCFLFYPKKCCCFLNINREYYLQFRCQLLCRSIFVFPLIVRCREFEKENSLRIRTAVIYLCASLRWICRTWSCNQQILSKKLQIDTKHTFF